MKLRHEPFWLDRLSAGRRPSFPRLRAHLDARVVIVGGGLTGAATAWSLAAARVPVVLLEADSVCSCATAGSAGLIREDAEGAFAAHASLHGLRAARLIWQAFRRASLEFPSALRRLGIRCDAARQDLLTIASRGSDTRALRREYDARRAAGVEARWLAAAAVRREAGIEAVGAIKTDATAFDPYRAGTRTDRRRGQRRRAGFRAIAGRPHSSGPAQGRRHYRCRQRDGRPRRHCRPIVDRRSRAAAASPPAARRIWRGHGAAGGIGAAAGRTANVSAARRGRRSALRALAG